MSGEIETKFIMSQTLLRPQLLIVSGEIETRNASDSRGHRSGPLLIVSGEIETRHGVHDALIFGVPFNRVW